MYGFKAEPFQQWGLGTDMMIGLGRAAGLLWAPVGTSVRETAIHKLTHETHPLLGSEEGKHSMSQEQGEVWNPTTKGMPHEPGF
jgi:hypothetical protein